MSEQEPSYTASIKGYYEIINEKPELDEDDRALLSARRRYLIYELRYLDRKLGRPQTIPERHR